MSGWGGVLFAMMALIWAVNRIVEDRKKGIRIDWRKTVIAALASIAAALAGLCWLFVAMRLDWPITGAVGCMTIIVGGVVALAISLRRYDTHSKPPPPQ